MKKTLGIWTLTVLLAGALTACGQAQQPTSGETEAITSAAETVSETETQAETAAPVASTEQHESTTVAATPTQSADSNSNVLIAYFTWAENTHVEHPELVNVDATTSASVLLPGNAAKLAGWIQEETGGDLFSIVVTEPYSSDYDECLDRAADEKAANARPELVNHVENMDQYDVVFLGFPNWWYTVPMAVHSFLEEYDFSGKTVVPFVTHGTGGLSSTIRDIRADLPDSVTLLDPIGVYRPEVDQAQPEVLKWLEELNLEL